MHRKYGPIVRTTPNEVHILDIDFLDEMYPGINRKREKPGHASGARQHVASFFNTMDHDLHRKRRSVLNHLFSKKAVTDLSDVVHEKVGKLKKRLEEAAGEGAANTVLRLDCAFMALTSDIITEYSFGESFNSLDEPDFNLAFKHMMYNTIASSTFNRQFPFVLRYADFIPPTILRTLFPNLVYVVTFEDWVRSIVEKIVDPSARKATETKTIFHEIKDSRLPPEEKSVRRLTGEGLILVAGGAETTARALTLGSYHLIQQPETLRRLREELARLPAKNNPPLSALESSPYLAAVVHESVRLGGSAMQPLSRIAPTESLRYTDGASGRTYVIPPGCCFGIAPGMVCYDENIFPDDPHVFRPERWLENHPAKSPQADKRARVLFGVGGRHCLGMNLAVSELYTAIAAIFRDYDLETCGTTDDDIVIKHWCVAGLTKPDSRGLNVRVKRKVASAAAATTDE